MANDAEHIIMMKYSITFKKTCNYFIEKVFKDKLLKITG